MLNVVNRPFSFRIAKVVLPVIVIALIIGYIFFQIEKDWQSIQEIDISLSPLLISLHLLSLGLMFFFMTFGWHYSLLCHGCPVKFKTTASIYLASTLGKYLPGKIIAFVGRIEFTRKAGVRRSTALSAMIFEHVCMLLAAIPFLAFGIYRGLDIQSWFVRGLLSVIVFSSALCVARPQLLINLLNRLLNKFNKPLLDLHPSSKQLLILCVFYLGAWTSYGLSGVALAHIFNLSSDVSILLIMSTFVSAWLIGFASLITPAGIGVRELVLGLLLTIDGNQAICYALGLVSRITWTVVEIVAACVSLALLRKTIFSSHHWGK